MRLALLFLGRVVVHDHHHIISQIFRFRRYTAPHDVDKTFPFCTCLLQCLCQCFDPRLPDFWALREPKLKRYIIIFWYFFLQSGNHSLLSSPMVAKSASPIRFLHPELARVVLDVEFLELIFLPHVFELEAFGVNLVEKLG